MSSISFATSDAAHDGRAQLPQRAFERQESFGGFEGDGDRATRNGFPGQGATAEFRLAGLDRHRGIGDVAKGLGDRPSPCFEFVDGQRNHLQQRDLLECCRVVFVGLERGVEEDEGDLVQPQRALHRVGVQRGDQVPPADDDAGLCAAQELVAGEGDKIGARVEEVAGQRLPRQAEPGKIHQGAAARVHAQGQLVAMGDLGGVADRHLASETLDAVVARVNL